MSRTTRLGFEVAVLVVKPCASSIRGVSRYLLPMFPCLDTWPAQRPDQWRHPVSLVGNPLKYLGISNGVSTFMIISVNRVGLWATDEWIRS